MDDVERRLEQNIGATKAVTQRVDAINGQILRVNDSVAGVRAEVVKRHDEQRDAIAELRNDVVARDEAQQLAITTSATAAALALAKTREQLIKVVTVVGVGVALVGAATTAAIGYAVKSQLSHGSPAQAVPADTTTYVSPGAKHALTASYRLVP